MTGDFRAAGDTALFSASLLAQQAGRFVFSLAVAGAVVPAAFTGWTVLVAALAYLPIAALGTLNGMIRELPYQLGAGQPADAEAVEAAMWRAVGAAVALIMVGALAVAAATGSVAVATAGAMLALSLGHQAQQSVLRARLRTRDAAAHQLALAVTTAAGAVLITAGLGETLAGVAAVYAGCVAAGVAVGEILHRNRLDHAHGLAVSRHRSRARHVATDVRALASAGLPLTAAGTAFAIFWTSDRWLAAALLGAADAAPYAMAALLASGLLVVPAALSHRTYPEMSRSW